MLIFFSINISKYIKYNKIFVSIKNNKNIDIILKSYFNKNIHLYFDTVKPIYYKIIRIENKIKKNIYNFNKIKRNMLNILKFFNNTKKNNLIKLTIPEGNNIKQTADIISKIINIDKKKFIEIANNKKLEGYLMPETYFVNQKTNEEQIIEIMYNEFNKKITPDIKKKIKNMKTNLNNIIIIASIIEKEAVLDEERKIISSVFYNRLKMGMKLQSCSTVLYAIGSYKNKLSIEDTKFNSPYNTYIYSGLPPGPISNPGMKSINAAINPLNTDYLFFVSFDNNSHMFAKNYADHIKNKKMIELMNAKGHVYVT